MASSESFGRPRASAPEFVPRGYTVETTAPYRSEGVPDVKTQLKTQIEWYFGLENLSRDFYLNSCMDASNFVSIHFVAAFPRVKSLTSEVSLVVETMTTIPTLEVNADAMMVRPRHMPVSREIRIKSQPAFLPPVQYFLDNPQNLEFVYTEPYYQDTHIILVFKTEADAAVALAAIRTKASAEGRQVWALLRAPTVFFRQPNAGMPYVQPGFGMFPQQPPPPQQQHQQQQMFFNPSMPYQMPPAYMFPGPNQYNQQFRPPQDRRNRTRSAAGSTPGFRRDEPAAPAPLPPRNVTEGSVPVAELTRREFSPRRGAEKEKEHTTASGNPPRRAHANGEQRPRGPRRHDGHNGPNHQSHQPPAPQREPPPALGTELFPPLAASARPTAPPAKASTEAAPAAEEAAAAVAQLQISKDEPEEPARSTSSPDRPSFAEMLKRKQSAEAAKRAQEAATSA